MHLTRFVSESAAEQKTTEEGCALAWRGKGRGSACWVARPVSQSCRGWSNACMHACRTGNGSPLDGTRDEEASGLRDLCEYYAIEGYDMPRDSLSGPLMGAGSRSRPWSLYEFVRWLLYGGCCQMLGVFAGTIGRNVWALRGRTLGTGGGLDEIGACGF